MKEHKVPTQPWGCPPQSFLVEGQVPTQEQEEQAEER